MTTSIEQRPKEHNTQVFSKNGDLARKGAMSEEDSDLRSGLGYLNSVNNHQNVNHMNSQVNLSLSNSEPFPPYYSTSSVNSGLPPMPFPYLGTAIGETWSTGGSMPAPLNPTSLFPSGFGTVSSSEQFMHDQVFNQGNTGITGTNFLNGLNQSSGLSGNFMNQPSALFFPGNSDLSWGEQTQGSSGSGPSLLPDFYRPPPPPISEQGPLDNVGIPVSGNFNPGDNVEKAFSGLNLNVDSKDDSTHDVTVNGLPNAPSPTAAITQASVSPGANPQVVSSNTSNNAPSKPMSWASIASQPAKPKPKPPPPKPKMPLAAPQSGGAGNKGEGSSWGGGNTNAKSGGSGSKQSSGRMNRPRPGGSGSSNSGNVGPGNLSTSNAQEPVPVLAKLQSVHNYNPKDCNLSMKSARFFIIKSYSEDDIHRSIKYNVWCSTEHGNRRLNEAFKEQNKTKSPTYLLFSVNGSGHFCGVAQMVSEVDLCVETGVWSQDKWKGKFEVKWIYVKDVPNTALRHIRLENNDNKPVTNSRDTQEVPPEKGKQVIRIIHQYKHQTSIFDDFGHYERRQEEEEKEKGGRKLVGVKEP